MYSALYVGRVSHDRREPVDHRFTVPMFMMYLDLAELDEVFRGRWLWSARRPAPAWFRRADYLGDPDRPLDEEVRARVQASGLPRPEGPVRLLTHLRYLGYVQNPVSFYYCFTPDDAHVEAVVAEITNTPWGERHSYVIAGPRFDTYPGASDRDSCGALDAEPSAVRARFRKAFHVSPFMPMTHEYLWSLSEPGQELAVDMANLEEGRTVFTAKLRLRRREITGGSLATALLRFPWMSARVVSGIYLQAARLWLKRVPFHEHPGHGQI